MRISKYSHLNHDFFDKPSGLAEYLIGYIYTDGSLQKKFPIIELACHIKDRDILEKICLVLEDKQELMVRPNSKAFKVRTFLYSSKIYNYLLERNIVVNKSSREEFPIPVKKYFYDFLRGFLDGDGSLWVDKDDKVRLGFYSANCEIVKLIQSFIKDDLELNSTLSCTKDGVYRIHYYGFSAISVLDKIYNTGFQTLRSGRKHDKYILAKEVQNNRKNKLLSQKLLVTA